MEEGGWNWLSFQNDHAQIIIEAEKEIQKDQYF